MTLTSPSSTPPASTKTRKKITLSDGSELTILHDGFSASVEWIVPKGDLTSKLRERRVATQAQLLEGLASLAGQIQGDYNGMAELLHWFVTKSYSPDEREMIAKIAKNATIARLSVSNYNWRLRSLELKIGSEVKVLYQDSRGYQTLLEATITKVE